MDSLIFYKTKGVRKMNNLLGSAQLFLKKNGSTILTCLGAAGVVATTVLAVKATPKAMAVIEKAEEEKGEKLTKLETVKVAAPAYIPTALSGLSTIACILGANILNKHTQASLMSAYALVDNAYKEYKRKVNDIYGDESARYIREEIASDKYEDIDITPIDTEKELFFDFFSLRYFEATMERVMSAEDKFNEYLSTRGYVSLNDFYDLLGLPVIDCGYDLGWTTSEYGQIDFNHDMTTVGIDDNLECCVISFAVEPVML